MGGLGELHDLLPRGAVRDQVDHREAIDEDEVVADGGPDAFDDLDGEAHPVLVGAAPAVGALVGVGDEELVDEVAFRPHDLDPVIARLASARSGGGDVGDLFLDPVLIKFFRREGRDRGFDGRGGDAFGAVSVAACMEDRHRDLAAIVVDSVGDDAVVGDVVSAEEARGAGEDAAFLVGGHAAGDHQGNPAAGAFGIEGGDAVPVLRLLQPCVHRAHEDAVLERRETKIERCEQMGIIGHGAALLRAQSACG